MYGEVVSTGRSSITIKLTAMRYDVVTSEEVCVCENEMVFIKVDEVGKPIKI